MLLHPVDTASTAVAELEDQMREWWASGVDVYGLFMRKLDDTITAMDEGLFTEKDRVDMASTYPVQDTGTVYRPAPLEKTSRYAAYFAKVYVYQNSRLPPDLPSLRLHPQTFALFRLAAQYSRDVYYKPMHRDSWSYVGSDWRHGTKAMMIKSVAVADMNTVVLAIRGTQSFRDWAVNVKTAPTSPSGFLDDPSNACHAGFLSVAHNMIHTVASRLRKLIAANPGRAPYSLLITGHSAGGAVASLLYCHMLSLTARSELAHLTSFFKSVHCVTFGAPPVSIRPLFPPPSPSQQRSAFFSFVNEGDPVARADKTYITSLLNLYASPTPHWCRKYSWRDRKDRPAVWRVPVAPLSLAGQIVVLRARSNYYSLPDEGPEGVEACLTTDLGLRQIVFGDPLMHAMALYARRIDELTMDAYR
ncbi:lipase family protein [Aspergillus candidus]|uniref:Alpha/beta-hydrolase n=1 Tax=Aspergillus candidus TaxID=41067 RepID=A0A2I2FI40_ASPCN|nr:alpha/beta-hydrolase [Aspergillus candidus]PLB40296.1 alpha/beta-hydrolase [Aspergillus candidus]